MEYYRFVFIAGQTSIIVHTQRERERQLLLVRQIIKK